jgi:hypothetical protein
MSSQLLEERVTEGASAPVRMRCPSCQARLPDRSAFPTLCAGCGAAFDIRDGIIDLRLDRNFDTLLDVADYDASHSIDAARAKAVFDVYMKYISAHAHKPISRVLEIGSGSGTLTAGLLMYSPFDEFHCSDISLGFLTRL